MRKRKRSENGLEDERVMAHKKKRKMDLDRIIDKNEILISKLRYGNWEDEEEFLKKFYKIESLENNKRILKRKSENLIKDKLLWNLRWNRIKIIISNKELRIEDKYKLFLRIVKFDLILRYESHYNYNNCLLYYHGYGLSDSKRQKEEYIKSNFFFSAQDPIINNALCKSSHYGFKDYIYGIDPDQLDEYINYSIENKKYLNRRKNGESIIYEGKIILKNMYAIFPMLNIFK